MGLYREWIFPRLLDVAMATSAIAEVRHRLLQTITGHVLEIGFGTGHNLHFYPPTISSLTAVDSNPGTCSRARRRIRDARFPVDVRIADCSSMELRSAAYDCVVSTFTLCSVPDVDQVLAEVRRVLKPGGRLFFAEHGLSTDEGTARWQRRLTPVQKIIGDGCHLDRRVDRSIVAAGFSCDRIENYYLRSTPRVAAYMYEGIAQIEE